MSLASYRTRRSAVYAPRTFAEAHFHGMEATARLRKRLGGRVRALIAISRGDVDQVAVALGMLPWKLRRIAEGAADLTLGEIERIANVSGDTPEIFIARLLGEETAASGRSRRRQAQRHAVQGSHGE